MEHQKRASVLYSASWETLYGNAAGSDTTPCLQLEIVVTERGRRKCSYDDRCSCTQMIVSWQLRLPPLRVVLPVGQSHSRRKLTFGQAVIP